MHTSNSFPIFQAKYHVLVFQNADATEDHERVLAICLEQNLVGRGNSVPRAMDDLAKNIIEVFQYEWRELKPTAVPDPDPELKAAFSNTDIRELDGDIILQRFKLILVAYAQRIVVPVHRPSRTTVARKEEPTWEPQIRYEPAYAFN